MITKISLENYASYRQVCEFEPTTVNYIYGANGSGKTSIGRLIASESQLGDCKVDFDPKISRWVYNKAFVINNFSQSTEIKGIFTLGQEAKEVQEAILKAREEIAFFEKKINGVNTNFERNKNVYEEAKEIAIDSCWPIKKKYESVFKPALAGYIGSKGNFFAKCSSIERDDSLEIISESELIDRCNKVFNTEIKEEGKLPLLDFEPLIAFERSEILRKKIIGNEDIPFGKLIINLNNSDWVKKGLGYVEDDRICPFCQQDLNESIIAELNSFFNKEYNDSLDRIKAMERDYNLKVNLIKGALDTVLNSSSILYDFENIQPKVDLLIEYLANNETLIRSKYNNPSLSISLHSIEEISKDIIQFLEKANHDIEVNNDIFRNLSSSKTNLALQVWAFIRKELNATLVTYNKKLQIYNKTDRELNDSLKKYQERISELRAEIRKKESQITSVTHSVNEINRILYLFGFTNFTIAESSKTGFYKVIREDGSDVHETLSEGEYNLLTFLYFYHLIKGNTERDGILDDRIIVIDDPMSSLDSGSLYLVSNLVKSIIDDVLTKKHHFKQLFLLTHNVYFYKEITFRGIGQVLTKAESFWILKKVNNASQIQRYNENPITTSYELLWRELDSTDSVNRATIFNTLRRILEYYFKILGGINYEVAINKFEGEERKICKSLISFINDGSHFIYEEDIITLDEETVQKYIKVFELVFINLGHENHYRMMRRLPVDIVEITVEKDEPEVVLDAIENVSRLSQN